QFPPPFLEWNDRYRDAVRRFWIGDRRDMTHGGSGHGLQDLATRLAGSRDLFGLRDRGPTASVNFLAAHDGFTVADLTAYDHKHNDANGEANGDGSNGDSSWNHGVEGPTEDPRVLAARRQTMRNLIGTLLISTGVPMLTAGDELGRTQQGNNNPYCQDGPISWIDWDLEPWQEDMLATTRHLVSVRRALPALRQRIWAIGRRVHDDGTLDMDWFAADGDPLSDRWSDTSARVVQMYVAGGWVGQESALVVVNGSLEDVEVTLPAVTDITAYRLLWDSTWTRPHGPTDPAAPGPVVVGGSSLRVYGGSASATG
ncbi:MAG: glycogen debranching enzyme GlgX, partial [Ornithinibacter sp.]